MEQILSKDNLNAAYLQIVRNKGAAGIDGMTVEELGAYLSENGESIREQLRTRKYKPQPVRRVEIPKPDGGVRNLGVPTVVDRFVQQAVAQVLTPIFEEQFHDHSYGFRPNRCAQQAVLKALEMMNDGHSWIVDIDLAKFFDTVDHDKLMTIFGRTIKDGDVISVVRKFLVSGVMIDDEYEDTIVGTPQGGNISPLLANIMLNELDKELERLLGKAEYSFTIEGTIQKAEGQNVSLSYGSRDSQQTVNTTISGGKFQLKGVMDNPYYAAMLAIGEFDPTGQKENNMAQLALEPGTITIDCPTGRLDAATIKGGKTQDEMNALNQEMMPVYKQLMAFNKQYYAAKNDKQREAVAKKMTPVQQQYGEIVKNFYKSHPDSYLSPQYYAMELGSVSYEDIKKQYEAFSEDVRLYSPEAKEIASELANLENVQPGHEAPDFTAKDINGKDFTMSSLKGKVVIIDFWASWCVPCRKSNPHMLELYRKYHDQGLEMVYVSDDDSNPDAWRKAVEKDGLTGDGFHHVLRGFKMDRQTGVMDHTNDISDKYAVHFLPTKYLIDREGKIVCKIAEGEDAKIDELIEGLLK